jgi:hypothetical protein
LSSRRQAGSLRATGGTSFRRVAPRFRLSASCPITSPTAINHNDSRRIALGLHVISMPLSQLSSAHTKTRNQLAVYNGTFGSAHGRKFQPLNDASPLTGIAACPLILRKFRAKVEAAIARYERVIGDALRSRSEETETTEVAIAARVLNQMLGFGRSNYVRTV